MQGCKGRAGDLHVVSGSGTEVWGFIRWQRLQSPQPLSLPNSSCLGNESPFKRFSHILVPISSYFGK